MVSTKELWTALLRSGDLPRACSLPVSSTPSAREKRAVESSCPFLLKGPESLGNPQKFWQGTFHWRAAKAKGPKAHKQDGTRWDGFRGSSIVAVKNAAVWEGKGEMLRSWKEISCSSGAPDHLPRVTLVLPGKPCGPTEDTWLLAARCLRKEGAYGGASEEEALSPIFRSEHLEKKRVISVLGCCCSLLWGSVIFLERFL